MNQEFVPVKVLLVEDNPGEVELAREALSASKLKVDIVVASNGVEALRVLETAAPDELPHMMFLDLNMPKMSGIEVLKVVKSHPTWGRIPVVILSSSKAESDIARSYDLHANCYVTKPIDFTQFMAVVNSIEEFWFAVVTLPRKA